MSFTGSQALKGIQYDLLEAVENSLKAEISILLDLGLWAILTKHFQFYNLKWITNLRDPLFLLILLERMLRAFGYDII